MTTRVGLIELMDNTAVLKETMYGQLTDAERCVQTPRGAYRRPRGAYRRPRGAYRHREGCVDTARCVQTPERYAQTPRGTYTRPEVTFTLL